MNKGGFLTLSMAGAFVISTSYANTSNTHSTNMVNNKVASAQTIESKASAKYVPATATTAVNTQAEKIAKNTQDSNLLAKLKLEQKQNQLFAYITLTQTQKADGKVQLHWQAPEHSGCPSSVYALSYQNKSYHTKAFRTVAHNDAKGNEHVCSGTWTAKVYDENNKVIASNNFDVPSSLSVASVSQDNKVTPVSADKMQLKTLAKAAAPKNNKPQQNV